MALLLREPRNHELLDRAQRSRSVQKPILKTGSCPVYNLDVKKLQDFLEKRFPGCVVVNYFGIPATDR